MTGSLVSSLSNVLSKKGPISVSTCTGSYLQLFVDSSLLVKSYWIVYPVLNHFSIEASSISVTITSKTGNYLITSGTFLFKFKGSTQIILQQGQIPFQVTNTNPILSALSAIQIKQSQQYTELNYLNYMGGKVQRNIRLRPPQNLVFTNSTIISSLNSSLCQIISVSTVSLTSIDLTIEGYVMISLANIVNPSNYIIGDQNWTYIASDRRSYPCGSGDAIQLPEYSGVEGKFSYSMTNKTIQQSSNLTIQIEPQLTYTQAISSGQFPDIIITLSDSQFINILNCPTVCTQLSSKKLSVKLSASFISQIVIQVKNSLLPTPISQQIQVEIKYGSFLYESLKKIYTLQPMSLSAVSGFSGLYGEMGVLTVNLTTMPSRSDYVLLYSAQETILQSPVCDNCNSSSLILRGRVKYFQKSNLTLIAKATINGTEITYAQTTTEIRYTCMTIPGCRICINQTLPNSTVSLICQKCFDKSLNNFSLLYQKKCVDACPVQTYSDEVNCKSCPQNCYNCSDSSTCLQCMPDYFVYMQTCVTACPADFTKNSTHCLPKQIICPTNCINCPEDNVCDECEASYKLFKNICYSQCPAGYVTSKFNSTTCQLFIPPQEIKYFPFAFVICSLLFLIVLIIIRCFEQRSLVMGNFMAIASVLEFGSFLMTLVYTLIQVQLNLFLQALLFVIILSKVLINLAFLVYFLKNIRSEEQFCSWLQKYSENTCIYYIAIVLSTSVSFNIFRIIYSRFMGLKIFFGKFSSGLIFKPINFLSIALTLIYSAPLITMCVYQIDLQQGYKTKIYYSAIETIIMQGIIFVAWIIDWKRGKADEFFDFQVYKIQNSYDQSMVNPIGIGTLQEIGGSTQEVLKSYRKLQQHAGSKIPQWQRKRTIPFSEGALSIEPEDIEYKEQPQLQKGSLQSPSSPINEFKKRKSLFKLKILDEWRQISKHLPSSNSKFKILKKSQKYISKSPYDRISKPFKKNQKLKKSSSLDKIEVKFLDTFKLGKPEKARNYFHEVYEGTQNVEKDNSIISSVKEKQKSPKQIKERQKNSSQKNQTQDQSEKLIQNPFNQQNEYEISPITEMNEEKSLNYLEKTYENEENDKKSQHLREENIEQMLEQFTENNEQKGQNGFDRYENQQEQDKNLEENIADISEPTESNRNLKNSNFTSSTNSKHLLLNHRSFDKNQHRYNNHIRSSNVELPSIQKMNKSHNETNSMDVSLQRIFFQSNELSQNQHHRESSRRQDRAVDLTGSEINEVVGIEEEISQTNHRAKKVKLRKLSKAQRNTQQIYLERIGSVENARSLSKQKKYKRLSNF